MYVKIHDSIFGSSIMEEDIEIRYIWLCMLTIADGEGFIDETIPSLARRFNVKETLMQKAIKCFLEPDPSSRTKDGDGRRIEPIRESFGWHIINYKKYKEIRNYEDRKEYMKNYMRDYLPKYREGKGVKKKLKKDDKQNAYQDLSSLSDKQDKPNQNKNQNSIIYSCCPHQKIISLYHNILPEVAKVKEWTPIRAKMLKKRWDEKKERQTLDWWKGFFEYVKKSKFLMGDKTDFQADLEWLIRPTNFVKVIEGKYEDK